MVTSLIKMVVLATDSNGSPAFHTCQVEVTEAQYEQGEHYDLAKENASFNGYEEPMIAFDERDPAARQMGEIHVWL